MKRLTRRTTGLGLVLAAGLALTGAPAAADEEPDRTRQAQEARTIQVKILGMSCPFCAYGAEQKLKRLDGVENLEIELQSGIATLTMAAGADLPNDVLRKTIDDAGFEAAAIVRSFASEHEDLNPEKIPGQAGSGTGSAATSV